ncbi:hypothetical protein [Nocardia wallacei]|uniref:hypothetical protein n=1 Tax=Nocardia wallacei TaxID=480035 RepID=UPI0024549758|nr:hypothetical protein [Nocardia wallacei]
MTGPDPTDWLVAHVRGAFPELGATAARVAVAAAAKTPRTLAVLRDHLETHPTALTSGDPAVPPVVCTFITVLAATGAAAVLPRCSRCRKPAKRLSKSVEGARICTSCLRRETAEPCGRCGRDLPVAARDDRGRPLCQACRARDPRTHRACGICGTIGRVNARTADGTPLCRRCYRQHRPPERCYLCGQDRVPAHRTPEGPVCETCYRAPGQRCDACGRVGPLKTRRTPTQPALCRGCYRGRIAVCTRCGRERPTTRCTARDGEPTCASCKPRPRRRCANCHQVTAILTRWPIGDICGTCYAWIRKHPAPCTDCGTTRPLIGTNPAGKPICGPCAGQPDRAYTCQRCGNSGFFHTAGRCLRCHVSDRVRELLAGPDHTIPTELLPFATALTGADSPAAILHWLRPGQPATLLLEKLHDSGEPITHDLLDQLPQGLALHRLRQTLVHTGVLPERAEYLERLAPWLDQLLADQPGPRAHLLRTYVTWTVLRRARNRAETKPFTYGSNNWARTRTLAALRLLTWIDEQHLELDDVGQHHIDQWLVTGSPETTYPAREFLSWARKRRLVGAIAIPKKRSRSTLAPITEDERWHQLRRCLHEDTLPTAVRAAGALVLLYGLPVSKVATLQHHDIHTDTHHRLWLHHGSHELRLPPAVAALVLAQRDLPITVAAVNRNHPDDPKWLFSGGFPGRPARDSLYRRLRDHLHIHLRRARSAALAHLAGEIPAAVLAQLLDLNINTALAWANYAQNDWTTYLAARTTAPDKPAEATNDEA